MFCPECGHPLESAEIKFCPNCGSRIIPPQPVETPPETSLNAQETAPEIEPADAAQTSTNPSEPVLQTGGSVTRSKLCTAALLLGAGAFVFAMLTLICRMLSLNLHVFGAVATGVFFLAPLACCFGIAGIVVRAKNRNKRGLPAAIIGLLLGLLCGGCASYLLLSRLLGF